MFCLKIKTGLRVDVVHTPRKNKQTDPANKNKTLDLLCLTATASTVCSLKPQVRKASLALSLQKFHAPSWPIFCRSSCMSAKI